MSLLELNSLGMRRIRISAISYLNTAPLMWDFEHGQGGDYFDISYTLPSACAADLQGGAADVGIIPAAAYATVPQLVVIPGVAIASRRAVGSILLVSKLPLEQIHSAALDTSSLTSVALLKVLFAKWWGAGKIFTAMAPNLDEMLQNHDAGLVIGDPALRVNRSRYHTYDLAEEWVKLTGLPFVFAFWAVREDALSGVEGVPDLAAVFQRSRDHGLSPENRKKIVEDWALKLGMSQDDVERYLTENIHYYLDSQCLAGLRLFYRYAEECGALPRTPELHFLGGDPIAAK
jgi:chorismate dehydratase